MVQKSKYKNDVLIEVLLLPTFPVSFLARNYFFKRLNLTLSSLKPFCDLLPNILEGSA